MQLPDALNYSKLIRGDIPLNINDINQLMVANKIVCMASGQIGNELKFFFYA